MSKSDQYITPTQAAALKGVHHRTVMRAIKRGDLQAQTLAGPATSKTAVRFILRVQDVKNWTPRHYTARRTEGEK